MGVGGSSSSGGTNDAEEEAEEEGMAGRDGGVEKGEEEKTHGRREIHVCYQLEGKHQGQRGLPSMAEMEVSTRGCLERVL